MANFHHHRSWLFFFVFFCFLISHECDHSFVSLLTSKLLCWAIILLPYTPPWKPSSGLVLWSGKDAVDDDQSYSSTAPLSPILAAGIAPVKNCPRSLYERAAKIASEIGNTRGIWIPHCCGHQRSCCCPRCNHFTTESYPQSIFPDGQKYREWKAIPKVQPSSQGDSGFPQGWGYLSAP